MYLLLLLAKSASKSAMNMLCSNCRGGYNARGWEVGMEEARMALRSVLHSVRVSFVRQRVVVWFLGKTSKGSVLVPEA